MERVRAWVGCAQGAAWPREVPVTMLPDALPPPAAHYLVWPVQWPPSRGPAPAPGLFPVAKPAGQPCVVSCLTRRLQFYLCSINVSSLAQGEGIEGRKNSVASACGQRAIPPFRESCLQEQTCPWLPCRLGGGGWASGCHTGSHRAMGSKG